MTRERILEAAETQMALAGADAASISKILSDADQKNSSAITYHFGSRYDLIEAIMEMRIAQIDTVRAALYDRILSKRGEDLSIQDLVHVWVKPMAEFVRTSAGKSHYVRFITQILHHETYHRIVYVGDTGPRRRGETGMKIVNAVKSLMKPLPSDLIDSRIAATSEHMLASLAFLEATAADRSPAEWEWRIGDLIDMLVRGLEAPASPETLALLAGGGGPSGKDTE